MPPCSLALRVLGLVALCSACYIQNCPRGGKRDVQESSLRQCMACGPGAQGRCFGPRICCGGGRGCWVGGSPETAPCLGESLLASPCHAAGRPCRSEWGRCAAPGVCCDAESCSLDSDCQGEGRLPDAVLTSSASSSSSSAGSSSSSAGSSSSSAGSSSSPGDLLLRLLYLTTRGQSEY